MSKLAKFGGLFEKVTTEFLRRLDANFELASREFETMAVANAYSFRVDDTADSLQVNAAAAAITVLLPSPTGARRRTVIKTDASANAVTVSGNGYNIGAAGTVVLAAQYDRVTVEPAYAGGQWYRVD